jgi:hypothetical protein
MYLQRRPVHIETQTLWNLNGRSVTLPPPMLSPIRIFSAFVWLHFLSRKEDLGARCLRNSETVWLEVAYIGECLHYLTILLQTYISHRTLQTKLACLFSLSTTPSEPRPPQEVSRLHWNTPQSVELLWTSARLHRKGLYPTTHTRDRHPYSSEILNRNSSKRAAVDQHFWPRDNRHRLTCS